MSRCWLGDMTNPITIYVPRVSIKENDAEFRLTGVNCILRPTCAKKDDFDTCIVTCSSPYTSPIQTNQN